MNVGKCPKCGEILTDEDIEDIMYHGRLGGNRAYVCKRCRHIIGFSFCIH